jgi:hypothetical protein
MKFNQFDNNTSDFFMRITNGGNLVDVEKAIVVLAAIKPSGKVASQFVEVKNGLVYADLKPSMKDEIGTYAAQAMLILEDERVVTDVISYEVEEDKIFSLLNDTVETSEEFTLLTDMLSRLSTIEISEEQRIVNEAERILSEENRKIEEAKRVEAELIRQHEEADRSKYDATRESNENIRKQNESIRLANETNRIDEEAKRVEEENKRKLAEEERNANYNFMTEDEERRRLEANAHKEAEALRVQAETNRVNEEAKRRTTEQARVSAENTRVNNENTRKANETTRQTNEAKRVEAETQRQNRYNSFIADAEANANNFENYTNTAKVKEDERKSNELDRKSQEDRRVANEVERISNENTRKANEKAREKNETSRQNIFENKVSEVDEKIVELDTTKDNFISSMNTKVDNKISEIDNAKDNFVSNINTKVDTKISEIEVAKSDMTNTVSNKVNEVDKKIIEINATKDNFVSSVNTKVNTKISELDNAKSDMTNTVTNKIDEVETRFNTLTSSQQQDAEVIDARDGETSLKARLDRDIEKAKQVYVNVEGSNISTDSSVGYAKDVEILGNTVQSASNLADIRSVGDKIEGQELYEIPVLSCGKNLFDGNEFTPREAINQYSYIDGILTMSCDGQAYRRVDYILPNTLVHGKRYILTANVKALEYSSGYTPSQNFGYGYYNGGSSDYYGSFDASSNTAKLEFVYNEQGENVIGFHNEVKEGLTKLQWSNIQLEEGTQATPCEPYQEDKLTILSPTPLEKVGDVADRLICKDGVWGVEDNSVDILFNETNCTITMSNASDIHPNYAVFDFSVVDNKNYVKTSLLFCNKFNHLLYSADRNSSDKEGCWIGNAVFFTVKILKSKLESVDVNGMKKWLKTNNINLKYLTTQPQFIPLPHDQQIKLRTFANKTNISFGCEIEGTIKAQVPKSLGATVNTHTEQINNLNKELDRVKKLEESTVSTVTTESDFTTVEATSNGYFEDVKLEGKTLVNYISNFNNWSNMGNTTVSEDGASMTINATSWNKGRQISKSLPIGEYIFSINNPNNATIIVQNKTNAKTLLMGNNIDMNIKFSLLEVSEILITCKNTSETGTYVVNNPILTTDKNVNGYFEGLKSVGQSATTSEDGVDEISVESVKGDGNLFDATLDTQTKNGVTFSYDGATGEIVLNGTCTENNTCVMFKYPTKFIEGNTYYLRIFGTTINSPLAHIRVYDDKYVGNNLATTSRGTSIHKSSSTRKMVNTSIRVDSGITFNNFRFKVQLIVNEDRTEYIPHQSDKKRLLYYNEETQTWEKPILREWDSIEKHANAKYYYHQRSAEAVLNGSGMSLADTTQWDETSGTTDYLVVKCANILFGDNFISDKFIKVHSHETFKQFNGECMYSASWGTVFKISKSKLSTQDVAGFKQWLQANNVTAVYKLAEEKVYECTNIDLITYNGETNYIVNSGAITPRTTLKVHNNISNVVSLLQKKVSLLESNVTSYMITQNRLMLASRYNADNVTFKVDYSSMMSEREVEIDYDLFKLIQDNIIVGPENYDVDKMLEIMDLYAMIGFITWEMWDYLYEVIDSQINPVIGDLEGAPEI